LVVADNGRMNEHDSLVSHALHNMTVNELANAYADLKLKNKELRKALGSVAEIAKYLNWRSEIGFNQAQCLIDLWHGPNKSGIWVQVDKLVAE